MRSDILFVLFFRYEDKINLCFDFFLFRVGIGLMKVNLIVIMAPMASLALAVATAPLVHQYSTNVPVAITALICRL